MLLQNTSFHRIPSLMLVCQVPIDKFLTRFRSTSVTPRADALHFRFGGLRFDLLAISDIDAVRKRMENLKKSGSGTTCAVVGCKNSRKHLNEWLDRECYDHKPATKRQCSCPPLFTFFRKPDTDSESRAWLKALNLKKPPRNVFVCSCHFADKRPTKDNPFPEFWLGYNRFPQPKRRQPTERITASPQIKKRRLQSEGKFSNFSYETGNTVNYEGSCHTLTLLPVFC